MRAQTTEFNWVFIGIAGALILMFFFFVAMQLKSANDLKQGAIILANFDAILSGSQASPNTLTTIQSSESITIHATCELDFGVDIISELSVPGAKARKDISQKILFTPSDVSGNFMYVAVKPIQMPIHVDNAVLLTDDKTYFAVFDVHNNTQLARMYGLLPNNISKAYIGFFGPQIKNYDRIIVLSDQPPLPFSIYNSQGYGQKVLRGMEVHWLQLNNTVMRFYIKEEKDSDFTYDGEFTVPTDDYAIYALFSKDAQYYACSFKKIISRIQLVSSIYYERTVQVKDKYEQIYSDTVCNAFYLEAMTALRRINQSASSMSTSYDVFDYAQGLIDTNKKLSQSTCPVVY